MPGTEVLLKRDVIANDAKLLARVYDAPIGLMVAIAFVVGVLVVGLVIYTATIERRREYGALKAIGARNRILYRVVTIQALIAAVVGVVRRGSGSPSQPGRRSWHGARSSSSPSSRRPPRSCWRAVSSWPSSPR